MPKLVQLDISKFCWKSLEWINFDFLMGKTFMLTLHYSAEARTMPKILNEKEVI